MIRINLALKKQVSYSSGEGSEKTGTLASLRSLGSSSGSSGFASIAARIVITLGLCGGAFVGFDYWMQSQKNALEIESSNLEKEKDKIQEQLKKYSGFEKQKTELDRNIELVVRKNETIESLIRGKDQTVKSLIVLSQSIPKEVWITEISANEKITNIRGSTIDIALISDFMSKLGTSIYYKDVSLKGSSSEPSGRQSNFEITAGRE